MGQRIIVLRHGETPHNAAGIWQGHLDVELSPVGVEQARAVAPVLAQRRPDLIVTSDLARAAATADMVADLLGVSARRDERFREIHVGQWQGRTAAQVRAEYPVDADKLVTGEDFRRGGTGESVADVATRTLAAVQDVLAELPDDGLALIVSHGVSARALCAELVGIGQRQAWLQLGGLRNCHFAELGQVSSGAWRIDAWNVGAPGAQEGAGWPTDR